MIKSCAWFLTANPVKIWRQNRKTNQKAKELNNILSQFVFFSLELIHSWSMTCDMDLKIISLMAILWPFAWCQLVPSCGLATDCKNCTIIRDCVWCRQPVSLFSNANLNFKQWCKFFYLLQSFNGDRCMKRDEADRCSTQFVVDPQVLIQLIEDNPLAEAQKSEDPIQLRPQRVSMSNARKGNIKSFFKTKKNSWNVWLRNRSILYDSGWIQAS